ncbi:MAG: hypothetical protein DMG42_26140 [Acidobacteria bacterium]|nr:MAG: hypothetical protein DMG42_26140 [Acidobacteriota bacterium]
MLQRDFGIRVPTALADADLSRECSTWNTSFPTRAPLLLNPPQTSHAFSKPAGRASCLARLFHVEHSSEAGGPGTELFHVEQSSCGSSLFFPSSGDEAGGPTTELFHVEQSCGSSLFHVRVRALDALPSGSSSLARGSENHSPEGLVLRRIPASQSEPFLGKRMAVRNTAL